MHRVFLCLEDTCESLGIKGAALQSLAVTWHPDVRKRRQERTSVVSPQKAVALESG